MHPISYKHHPFFPEAIRLVVWLYFRFTTSLRDLEEMLAERGIDVSYETVRCWVSRFGRPSLPTSFCTHLGAQMRSRSEIGK